MGGVCLTPHPAGVLVSWAATDRLTQHPGRAETEGTVRATMTSAVADLLTVYGFPVQFPSASDAVIIPVGQA